MTIGPRNKISIMKGARRHSTWQTINLKKISAKYQVAKCTNCGSKKLAYRVCPSCGYYKGKQVITIKSKSSAKVIDA